MAYIMLFSRKLCSVQNHQISVLSVAGGVVRQMDKPMTFAELERSLLIDWELVASLQTNFSN
ncbi:hypothetical protein CBL_01887 [Carabus blaptoides fortunei]